MAIINHEQTMALVSFSESLSSNSFQGVDLEGLIKKVNGILPSQKRILRRAKVNSSNLMVRSFHRILRFIDPMHNSSLQSLLQEQYSGVDQLYQVASEMLKQTSNMYEFVTSKRDSDSNIPLKITERLAKLRIVISEKSQLATDNDHALEELTFEEDPEKYSQIEQDSIRAHRQLNEGLTNYSVLSNHISSFRKTRKDEKEIEETALKTLNSLGKICSFLSITRDRLGLISSTYPVLDQSSKLYDAIISNSNIIIEKNNEILGDVIRGVAEIPSNFYFSELDTFKVSDLQPLAYPKITEVLGDPTAQ